MTPHRPTALIAEDEPLLAQALQAELALAWPALQIVATVGDGQAAVQQALTLQPDILLFDIRMPGLSGIDAAREVAEDWPHNSLAPFPQLVFITAFDHYAVQAFETQAVDYLLKPVQAARLQKTVTKLQHTLALARSHAQALDIALGQLRSLLAPAPQQAMLTTLQASVGNTIHMVPLDQVLYLEAADKYLRVLTAEAEFLLRTPLKELLPRLDPQAFWQIHRGTVVRANAVHHVQRDGAGRLSLRLRGRSELLAVSRLYAHLFRAM